MGESIILGYIITIVYLLLVVLASVSVYRCNGGVLVEKPAFAKELSRKVIHIACGLGWFILKLFFEGTIHSVIITSSFILIAIVSLKKDTLHVQHGSRDFGLLYYTCVMAVLAVVSFFVPATFDAFGLAMVNLAVGDGMAALTGRLFGEHKWKRRPNKSIEGSIGGFLFASMAMLSLILIVDTPIPEWMAFALAGLGMFIEYLAVEFDNILIPLCSFLFALVFVL